VELLQCFAIVLLPQMAATGLNGEPHTLQINQRIDFRVSLGEEPDGGLCLCQVIVANHVLCALGVDVPVLEIELPSLVDALHRLLEVPCMLENPCPRLSHLHNSWGMCNGLGNKFQSLCGVALEVIQLREEVERPQESGWRILLSICCRLSGWCALVCFNNQEERKKDRSKPESLIFCDVLSEL